MGPYFDIYPIVSGKIFKTFILFSFYCHGNKHYAQLTYISRNLKKDDPIKILVKFGSNWPCTSGGDFFKEIVDNNGRQKNITDR